MTLFTYKHALFYSLSLPSCLYFSILCSSCLVCVLWGFCVYADILSAVFAILCSNAFLASVPRQPCCPPFPSSFPFPVSFCLQSSLLHECLYTRIHSYICHTRSYIFIVDFYGHLLMQKLFEQNKQNENVWKGCGNRNWTVIYDPNLNEISCELC